MIGLRRGTVKLSRHDPRWKLLFVAEKRRIEQALGGSVIDIQHIGSTAIKGIKAKPIIDIAIAIDRMDFGVIEKLEAIGYEYRGDAGQEGGHIFITCSEPERRTHHLHVVHFDDSQWQNYMEFRDLLNNNRQLALEYEELKEALEQRHAENRKAYTSAKKEFIKKVVSEFGNEN